MPVKSKKHKILSQKTKKTKKRGGYNDNDGNDNLTENNMNNMNTTNPMNPINEGRLSSNKYNLKGIVSDDVIQNVKLSLDNIETLKAYVYQLRTRYTRY
jgi:hypothetical protein